MNSRLILPIVAIVATAALSFGLNALAGGTFAQPTGAPTSNNAYAPLDTSSNANTKGGSLTVAGGVAVGSGATLYSGLLSTSNGAVLNTAGATNGLIVQNGNVGIDTASPTKALTINGALNVTNQNGATGNLGSHGLDPDNGYPIKWSGGVHTWDVYAEGSIGAGLSGAPVPAAYMNGAGTISGSTFCLGGNCITSWPGSPGTPAQTGLIAANEPYNVGVTVPANTCAGAIQVDMSMIAQWNSNDYPNNGDYQQTFQLNDTTSGTTVGTLQYLVNVFNANGDHASTDKYKLPIRTTAYITDVTNAHSFSGSVSGYANITVNSATYTLSCVNNLTSSAIVNPVVSLTHNPANACRGDTTTVSWTSSGASSCTGSWSSGSVGTNGSFDHNNFQTTIYTLTCTSPSGGSSSVSDTVPAGRTTGACLY